VAKRFQVRLDLWVDAPDKEGAETQLRRVLDRWTADGLGHVDAERRFPVTLSHWRLRQVRFVSVLRR
jgi:hypothetical protein